MEHFVIVMLINDYTIIPSRYTVYVEVPSMGIYPLRSPETLPGKVFIIETVDGVILENSLISATIDSLGRLVSLKHKGTNR